MVKLSIVSKFVKILQLYPNHPARRGLGPANHGVVRIFQTFVIPRYATASIIIPEIPVKRPHLKIKFSIQFMKLRSVPILKNRRAVLDAGVIMLGIIVAIIAIVAATLTWSDVLEVSYVKLITEMPKFDYDINNGQESGNRNFEIYQTLRNIALVTFVFVIMFAGMSFVFEHVSLVPPETGYHILSKGLVFILFFFFFPPLWDLVATAVEQTSLWILNAEEPERPMHNVAYLLNKLGSGIECHPDDESCKFSLDKLVAGVTDPFTTLKNMFLTTFLAIFKAIAFLIFMFLTFLLGTIRLILTAIISIAMPLVLVLSLLPMFRKVTSRILDALFGLIMAPLFSALALVAGVAHLQTFASSSPDPIVEWFAALAVMGLVTFIPAIIVPALGSLLHSVSSVITGTVSTGTIVGGIISTRGMHLASGVANTIQNAKTISVSGVDLARSTVGSGLSMVRSGLRGTDNIPDHREFGHISAKTSIIERNFQPTRMGIDSSAGNTSSRSIEEPDRDR